MINLSVKKWLLVMPREGVAEERKYGNQGIRAQMLESFAWTLKLPMSMKEVGGRKVKQELKYLMSGGNESRE